MSLPKIEPEVFERFHAEFSGDTTSSFRVCASCGGACEYSLMSTLLPGEAEFMSSKKGMDLSAFRDAFLDGVLVEGEVMDVLKCSDPCEFLNKDNKTCTILGYKPIDCLIYPITFELVDGKWDAILDDECPLAQNREASRFFWEVGLQLVRKLNLSDEIVSRLHKIDMHPVNFVELGLHRTKPVTQYEVFDFKHLSKFHLQ